MNDKIDFVITWVDGSDDKWLKKKRNFQVNNEKLNNENVRYRDFELLRYWFRSVETYAPWINKVYFITEGHLPEFINVDCERLVIVKHEDYIPKKYLPTFSSNPILLNLNKIKQLSEKFVVFDDDMFLNGEVEPENFFYNDLPVDSMDVEAIRPNEEFSKMLFNNMLIINKFFTSKDIKSQGYLKFLNKKNILRYPRSLTSLLFYKEIIGFSNPHTAVPTLKSTMNYLWVKEKDIFDKTCTNKFRSTEDITNWIFRYYQLASGKFKKGNLKKESYSLSPGCKKEVSKLILNSSYQSICLNDSEGISENEFEILKQEINKIFQKKFPKKSSFEL